MTLDSTSQPHTRRTHSRWWNKTLCHIQFPTRQRAKLRDRAQPSALLLVLEASSHANVRCCANWPLRQLWFEPDGRWPTRVCCARDRRSKCELLTASGRLTALFCLSGLDDSDLRMCSTELVVRSKKRVVVMYTTSNTFSCLMIWCTCPAWRILNSSILLIFDLTRYDIYMSNRKRTYAHCTQSILPWQVGNWKQLNAHARVIYLLFGFWFIYYSLESEFAQWLREACSEAWGMQIECSEIDIHSMHAIWRVWSSIHLGCARRGQGVRYFDRTRWVITLNSN